MLERIGGECTDAISLWPEERVSEPQSEVRWLDDGEADTADEIAYAGLSGLGTDLRSVRENGRRMR